MTKAFEDMLYLLGGGARGYEVSAKDMDMAEIRKCAIAQGVWPIVYKCAEKTCDVSKWRGEFILSVAQTVSRKNFSLSVIKKLEQAGIRCCLVKGSVVSELYNLPDCRISGDTDIYIELKDEKKAIKLLEEQGYTIAKRHRGDNHLKATHPVGGLMELHIRMYSKPTEKIVFNDEIFYSKDYKSVRINGETYNTLNDYDHLLYLTAHYIKHLVNGGCGIRQIVDILLFMEKNKDSIDFQKYYELMDKLKYSKLLDVIKSIGTVYFGYDYPLCDKSLMKKLLTDTQNGGTFGFLADDRANFYKMYCSKRTNMNKLSHTIYMWLYSERNIFDKIFPPRNVMIKSGYTYAKHRLLYPVSWVDRWINLVVSKFKTKENNTPINNVELRIEMMKELGMID